MRKKRILIGLISIALLSVACGGDRYAIVSGEDGVYRLDKRTGEVIWVRGRIWRVLSPAPEKFATAELRDVRFIRVQEDESYGDGYGHYYVTLYNGTAIEFSEITFRVRTVHKAKEVARLYRTQVNLGSFAAQDVPLSILTDGAPPTQVVLVSAKGIRRGT